MLNRDRLFDEMGGIRDAYILSAADLLGYEKEDKLMHLPQTARVRKMTRAILIAAAITALLAATAFAAFFAFSYRVPEQSETFRISWVENPGGYIEWSDAKLAVTFPDTAVSQKIEFRPGWLPFELPQRLDLSAPGDALTADSWFTRLTAESLCWQAGPNYIPEYSGYTQPLEIKTYSMAEFNDGGALLMLYQTPGEIAERAKTRTPAMRLRVPDEDVSFVDGHFGPVCENLERDCGDVILRRSDGLFAYQLAVVVDDALSGVTEIVRGRDILSATPRQIYLQRLLGYATPAYRHIPLLMDSQGRRLAKRDKDLDLTALSKVMTPEQILGMLAFSAGVIPENRPAGLTELTKLFDWKNVKKDDIWLAYP